jgi:hypothetical protein
MITAVGLAEGAIGGFFAAVALSVVKSLIEGEIHGALEDWLKRRVRAAAAELPQELAEDHEDEWMEELAERLDRPRLALRYVRGLSKAAREIAADTERRLRDLAPADAERESETEPVGRTLAIPGTPLLVYVPARAASKHGESRPLSGAEDR